MPQPSIAAVLGQGSHFAVVLAALIGIPLYLNNVAALPIVSGLLAQGMQPGAAIAFLIAACHNGSGLVGGVGRCQPTGFRPIPRVLLVGAVVLGWLTNFVLG